MKYHIVACIVLLGLSAAGISAASPVTQVSPLALPIVVAGDEFAPPPPDQPREVRYRPRRWGRPPDDYPQSYGRRPQSFSQLHIGIQDVDGSEHPGVVVGFRGGLAVDPNVQIGGQVEWRHRGNSDTQVLSESAGPGGTSITVQRDLARSSSDLIPVMGLIQIGGSGATAMPYFGLAGGVEILHLSAEDFPTGEQFDGNFAGFGWQGWAGVSMPLSGQARVNVEAFYNGATDLSRDVDDPTTGETLRESVDMSGAGARVGLAWGF
ncbi:MAG: hypothetical protein E6K80_05885 [Candidatus Eisenbacteria bacterium]|uniref:Porin family protein n=1 Tax=Eiseniibacteriota bacterium TaxID=2212470 RepID=A0A538U616_UNCEI|nr:MAG: hypothetical protein E6K80_05885 [Candidatus Eisenbacteria bacterium]